MGQTSYYGGEENLYPSSFLGNQLLSSRGKHSHRYLLEGEIHPLISLHGLHKEWDYERERRFRKQDKSTSTETQAYPVGPLH